MEKLWLGDLLNKSPKIFQHIYTIIMFVAGWLLFWIEDPAIMGEYALALFGAFGATGTSTMWELQAWSYWPILIVCIVACTPIVPLVRERLMAWTCKRKARSILSKGELANGKAHSSVPQCDLELWIEEAVTSGATKNRLITLQAVFLLVDFFCIALLLASAMSIVAGSFNPFIYFRF